MVIVVDQAALPVEKVPPRPVALDISSSTTVEEMEVFIGSCSLYKLVPVALHTISFLLYGWYCHVEHIGVHKSTRD